MGVLRSKHGVYHVRKKVPRKLEAAVSTVVGASKSRVSWLKRSLRTKDPREANVRAKPVLMEFDRVLARAEELLQEMPLRTHLSDHEIERISAYHFASVLDEDDEVRREGTGSEKLFQQVTQQLRDAGVEFRTPFATLAKLPFGLSDREMHHLGATVEFVLPAAKAALARGDTSFVKDQLDELLAVFRINLDRNRQAYRRLGMAVLRQEVKVLEAIERRNRGEAVETPPRIEPVQDVSSGATISAALAGWKKARQPRPNVVSEYGHAVKRFIELHGDLRIAEIKRSHVREFREALQAIPVRRTGSLRKASLPELVEWSNKRTDARKITPATVNKLLGGVQAIAVWGYDNGLTPDDVPWADPFARMRLEEGEPDREPWQIGELRLLFNSPVFASNARPSGGRGEAAYWLPLLGLYTGARQGELAPLTADDVAIDEATGITIIAITENNERGTRLKTASSRRVVPVHPELVKLGFPNVVEASRTQGGEAAPLFPLLKPGPRGGYAEGWSKWFGRYIRGIGIRNTDRVFHSFRHGFKDALRAAGESEDINDALTGHSGGGVGRSYGAKEMMRRFGLPRLAEAVAKVQYPGLDLSHLYIRREQAR
jgi:integrase